MRTRIRSSALLLIRACGLWGGGRQLTGALEVAAIAEMAQVKGEKQARDGPAADEDDDEEEGVADGAMCVGRVFSERSQWC